MTNDAVGNPDRVVYRDFNLATYFDASLGGITPVRATRLFLPIRHDYRCGRVRWLVVVSVVMLADLMTDQSATCSAYQRADYRMADAFTNQRATAGSDARTDTGIGASRNRDQQ
jgi:hypothetical protein